MVSSAISLRLDLAGGRIGPGKIALLEGVAAHGSIAAAGRAMNMSYRRAWELVAEINTLFGNPSVVARIGGAKGGGAVLTALGIEIVAQYRAAERAAMEAACSHLQALTERISPPPSS